jgi:hypothetical protein
MNVQSVQVSQAELREIFELEHEVAVKQARIEGMKESVKVLLIAKRPVELGRFDVRLDTRAVKSVAWRQIVVEKLGYAYAEECRRNTPANIICTVRIEEHAVLPLWNGSGEEDAGVSV